MPGTTFSTSGNGDLSFDPTAVQAGQEILYFTSLGLEPAWAMAMAQAPGSPFSMDQPPAGPTLAFEIVANMVAPLLVDNPNAAVEVVIVTPRGSATYGFGSVAGPGSPAPDGDSVFEIGSVTKTFTGTLLAKAALEGLVDLDAPANQYMPDWLTLPSAGGQEITLTHLTTHTSGIERDIPNNAPASALAFDQIVFYPDQATLTSFLADYPLQWTPGTHYEYSNVGASLAGLALTEVYAAPFEAILQEQILEPLGMANTASVFEPSSHRVVGYYDGQPMAWVDFAPPRDLEAPMGGIASTANDLILYLEANLGLVDTPLSEAMALAQSPLFAVTGQTLPPGSGREDSGLLYEVGFFWESAEVNGMDVVSHSGVALGFTSYLAMDVEKGVGVAVLLNDCSQGDSEVIPLGNSLLGMEVALLCLGASCTGPVFGPLESSTFSLMGDQE